MGAPRFFARDALSTASVGTEAALPADVAHHALRVLRLTPGDAVVLFDGTGGEYAGTITRAGKRDAWARIDRFDPVDRESPFAVTLVQAITASDTMDAVVRHAVELGTAAIQPVITGRSARFPSGAHGDKRLAHWRQVAVAACEQCGRNRVPVVHAPLALAAWLGARDAAAPALMLAPDASRALGELAPPAAALDVLVGPEGGFGEAESAACRAAGLLAVRLGPRVLRTETAGPALLAAANVLWGDFR